jgi:UDP-N-acetylmuramate--alanine ligase
VAVFQPHRYTRTQALWQEFCSPLLAADVVLLTEVYGAGELPIAGVSGALIWEGVRALDHPQALYLPQSEDLAAEMLRHARPGDVVLTLGAGDIWKVGEQLLKALQEGEAA